MRAACACVWRAGMTTPRERPATVSESLWGTPAHHNACLLSVLSPPHCAAQTFQAVCHTHTDMLGNKTRLQCASLLPTHPTCPPPPTVCRCAAGGVWLRPLPPSGCRRCSSSGSVRGRGTTQHQAAAYQHRRLRLVSVLGCWSRSEKSPAGSRTVGARQEGKGGKGRGGGVAAASSAQRFYCARVIADRIRVHSRTHHPAHLQCWRRIAILPLLLPPHQLPACPSAPPPQ